MLPFLLLFLLIYGIFHLYFYHKFRRAFQTTFLQKCCCIIFLLFMLLAPILCHIAERADFEKSAFILAVFGFLWMGFVFEFFCLGLLVDGVYHGKLLFGRKKSWSHRSRFSWVAGLTTMLCIYGSFEANGINLTPVYLQTNKLPPHAPPLTIAQISDVHLGLLSGRRKLQKILALLEKIQPDIIVSTGDLLDGEGDNLDVLAALLRTARAPLGKYAITGNHERYVGLQKAHRFYNKADFTLLDDKSVSPTSYLTIVGEGDRSPTGVKNGADLKNTLLASVKPERFILFLRHRPIVKREEISFFDLQLSGHTHKGQLFPFRILTRLWFPFTNGTLLPLQTSDGSSTRHLYVSPGTGTWGPPLRILAPPEITVFTLAKT